MKLLRAPFVRLAALILLTAGLFGCDYASKSAAKATLEGGEVVSVAPAVLRGAVELRYVENDDIAFNVLRRFGLPRSPKVLVALSSIGLAGLALTLALSRRRRSKALAIREGLDAAAPSVAGSRAAAPSVAGPSVALGVAAEPSASDGSGPPDARPGGDRTLTGVTLAGGALVVGGALGNLVDRIARGYVIDFIHVHGWPVFNVADIAVVAGMGLIALAQLARPRRPAVARS